MTLFRTCVQPLRREPFVSAVIILSLAIGIAANTIVFSWLRQARFNPLPGTGAANVMSLETIDDTGNYVSTSWREYLDLVERVPSLEAVAAQRMKMLRFGPPDADTRLAAQYVSGNFFSLLGVRPHLGRFFLPEESTNGAGAPVVVVSFDFWQRELGARGDIVGRVLSLNDVACTIIGVAAPDFHGGYNNLAFDAWVPAVFANRLLPISTELTNRKARPYTMLARLRPGATPAQVRTELDASARYLRETYQETNRGLAFSLLPLWRSPRGGQTTVMSLATLQVFTVLILVIVCTNAASLLLARATARRQEMAVRLALGATPRRLFALLLGESLGLALPAAGAGLLLSAWGMNWLGHLAASASTDVPLNITTRLDAGALVFAAGLAVACSVLFGLAPMLQLLRARSMDALGSARGTVHSRRFTRDLLIAVEVGVAVLVLMLGSAFAQSFRNALQANPGFDVDHTLLVSLDLAGRNYTPQRALGLYAQVLPELRSLPGVSGASSSSDVLLDLQGLATGVIAVAGKEFDPNRKVLYSYATPGHFAAQGLRVLDGTDLQPLDRTDVPVDAVINEEMAKRYWPEGSPVGKRFTINDTDYVISGVVPTSRYETLTEPSRPMAWLTMRSRLIGVPTLHVRTTGDPLAAVDHVRAILRRADPTVRTIQVRTMASHVSANLIMQRIPAHLLAALSPVALLIAVFGIYAVLAYNLAQRAQEIGVRLALGARQQSIVRLMFWQGYRVVLVGAALGWLGALAAGMKLHELWVGVGVGDPVVYGLTPLAVLAAAFFACWLPAHRYSRVDPTTALRAQ